MARQSAISFSFSACLHGSVLAWVAFSGVPAPKAPRSLYDQEIRPFEKKIVWYRFADKLPEISPSVDPQDSRPLRAKLRSPQTMVAGAKDDPNPGPMIWAPDPPPVPKVDSPKLELPNVIAVAPPKVLRPFVTPADIVKPEPDPALPEPPPIDAKLKPAPLPIEAKNARPTPRAFVPPPEKSQSAPVLPEPPRIDAKLQSAPLPIETKGARPAPRAFVPPPEVRLARQASLVLPEAPELHAAVVEPNALPFGPGARPRPRDFVPPSARRRTEGTIALDVPPEVPDHPAAANASAVLPRGFVTPPSRPMDRKSPTVGTDAPAVNAVPTPGAETTLAIVGLNPANTRDLPPPPTSRPAGFSSGPVERPDGASGANNGTTLLNVPGLTVRNGGPKDGQPTVVGTPFSPTSRENLMAAARLPSAGPSVARMPAELKPRSVEAPDPRLSGRIIYSIAIQMPNVTSYSGSWQVWFAEREPIPGMQAVDMRAPIPLRKVDPKYVAAAAADRVEGVIRLAAVIRKDGRVEQISLVRHLDDRLDRTAQEALSKWEFTPAARDGVPVDVDAVFEIPFHLAPRPGR